MMGERAHGRRLTVGVPSLKIDQEVNSGGTSTSIWTTRRCDHRRDKNWRFFLGAKVSASLIGQKTEMLFCHFCKKTSLGPPHFRLIIRLRTVHGCASPARGCSLTKKQE